VTAGWQERKLELDSSFNVASSAAEEGPIAAIEAELFAVGADEIKNRARGLVLGLSQASAELLKEQRGTFGRAKHEDGVDHRDVDALVE
jgi:hypothetical protein